MKRLLLAVVLLAGCTKGKDPPAASFACGNLLCTSRQYCWEGLGGVAPARGTGPTSRNLCEPIPMGCWRDASCACLAAHGVYGSCNDNAGLRVFVALP